MVTKNRSAFYNESGSAFYNESGSASESSPRFITYRQKIIKLKKRLKKKGGGGLYEACLLIDHQ